MPQKAPWETKKWKRQEHELSARITEDQQRLALIDIDAQMSTAEFTGEIRIKTVWKPVNGQKPEYLPPWAVWDDETKRIVVERPA